MNGKYDEYGNLLGAHMGRSSDDCPNSIATDANKNVYVTGYFMLTADFDPGMGVDYRTSNGDRDVFLEKLDRNGNFFDGDAS